MFVDINYSVTVVLYLVLLWSKIMFFSLRSYSGESSNASGLVGLGFPTLGGTNSSTKIVNSEMMGTIQQSSQGKRLNKHSK